MTQPALFMRSSDRDVGPQKGEAGFTLVEFLVVIASAAILMSILTLGFRRAVESFELRRAASTVVSEVRNAQAGALSNHTDYMVEFGAGTPGRVALFRQGLPVTGTVSLTSDGDADTRAVTIVGMRNGAGMVSDTIFLKGTDIVTQDPSIVFHWILQADTPVPNSCCTVSIMQGETTLATIPPDEASAAGITWTPVRVVQVPDWPRQVGIVAGGLPLPLCSDYGSPWESSSSRCLRFHALGYPAQAGELVLCSRAGVGRLIRIAAGTGRVGVGPGVCP